MAARKRMRALGKLLLVLLIVSLVRALLFQTYSVELNSMQPTLAVGDRVVSFPLPVGAVTIFGKLPRLTTIERGELLIVNPDAFPTESAWFLAWDSLARFFTLQYYSPMGSRYGNDAVAPGVYRVIGLPGDTIRRKAALYEIRPAGASAFSSEFALAKDSYSLSGIVSDSLSSTVNGSSRELNLGADQYFVACDDRSVLAGSALWGPVGSGRIVGRVVAVCWPPSRLKIP
ncbi:MAG: signal peptidase I [Rectinemataceae bacterium]|nr:signal peptidase I [Rectinemataceae bacterium]